MSFCGSFAGGSGPGSGGPGRRAQVSMEFLMVIGMAFLLSIPLIVLIMREAQGTGEQVSSAQVAQIARRMVSAAESVYAFGEPTSVVLKVYIPSGVNSSYTDGRRLVFVVDSKGDMIGIEELASMNLSGSFNVTPGIHNIKVTAANSSVAITEVFA